MVTKKIFGSTNKFKSVDNIINKSRSATCGIMEREVIVKKENVPKVKEMLMMKGFSIVGTSEPNGSTRKIWFIPHGGF